jgi:amino acid adenylation domain-containing protein
MPESAKFSCYLMGHQSRLIQCGDILLEKGHLIHGIISDVPSIRSWAAEKSLRLLLPGNDMVNALKQQPFDLFLSIDNFFKVPDEVLALPRMFAINFHDAPLPKYAGTNATNWALINRESSHGVTWHIMTNVIDAGDILKQKMIPISQGETALTLNAKCYETSVQIFAELLDELAEGRVQPVRQDLGERTFFPKWKRPPAACTIEWTSSAEDIDALYRGLNYGSYPNPLGLLKLFLGDEAVLIGQLELLQSASSARPGTLTKVQDDAIHVATVSRDIALREFSLPDGMPLSPAEFIHRFGLAEGSRLPTLDGQRADRITQIHALVSRHEDYWIKRLSNLEPCEIPYAKRFASRKNSATAYAEIRFETPESVIRGYESTENPGDFILTAFILYLYRIGAKQGFDLNFRDVALQLQLSGAEPFFAGSIPLHIEAEPEQMFTDFYRSVSKQIDTIKAHGSYARDLILRTPRLREILSHTDLGLPVAVERVASLVGYRARCQAELLVVIPDDGLACIWRYDQNIIDGIAIDRMQAQFKELLDDLAAGPARSITALSILPEQERHKILVEWNNTRVEYPRNVCLHQLFESQVERTPEAVAVAFEETRLTYRELNRRANQLAHTLKALGVGPETLVGLFMERSLEMVIGIYGIIKAGGAYVPLDPEYPPDRLAYMIEDTQVPVLLTQAGLVSGLPQHGARVICLDADWETIAREKTDNPAVDVRAENLAYVIYTSGSTGKPKGVMNEHRGVCNRILWMQDEYGLSESDRVLQKTPFSFDVSVWEFFWPLLVGASLVVARPGGHRDSDYLVKLIIAEEITTLHFVPSMLQMFLEEKNVASCCSLKRVFCSGEALPYDLQRRFFDHLDVELHNLYGPTEAAVDVTYWPCQRDSALQIVPIGYPVANTQMYILDPQLQPVPIGVSGELHIGGVQVARGYRNRPELTAEKFIPDPFGSKPDVRLYKTGDLARYLPNGAIEYIGRTDFQVKIRGLRIELGEIETLLAEYIGVSQSLVILREDQPGDKRLAAYLVCKPGYNGQMAELRNYLKKKLPDYMVPHHFIQLDAIPLSPNGKADRRALPKPTVDRISEGPYIAPCNSTQKTIAEIWQDLLRVKKVGIHDSFFDLGGHSLLLVKMLRRLKEDFAADLKIVDLFQYPTIAKLTEFLSRKENSGISLLKTQDLAHKQIASLKRQKRFVAARRKVNG